MAKKRATYSPQVKTILNHLFILGLPITHLNAWINYGCPRLSARISEIRELGYLVTTTMKTINGKKYASYSARV